MTIAEWFRLYFSDEQLAEFRELWASGKGAYCSCCCLVGAPFANHADGKMWGAYRTQMAWPKIEEAVKHLTYARSLPGALEVERKFLELGKTDAERRERILPKIDAEIARRATLAMEVCEEVLP